MSRRLPLFLPLAAGTTLAILAAVIAELVLSGGEQFPHLASSASMTFMLWVGLTGLGRAEQVATGLQDLRSPEGCS